MRTLRGTVFQGHKKNRFFGLKTMTKLQLFPCTVNTGNRMSATQLRIYEKSTCNILILLNFTLQEPISARQILPQTKL